jgi:hypothetical protein
MQTMKGILIIAASLAFLTASWAAPRNQKRGPSTAEERARAVQVAHRLQTDPSSAEAKQVANGSSCGSSRYRISA